MRTAIKRIFQAASLAAAAPAAALTLFGRAGSAFVFFSHAFALAPGLPGSYLRAAFYRLTLDSCSQDVAIGFGTCFSRSSARIGANTSIGNYCMIGRATIGRGCQISSLVNIPSGKYDHPRDASGRFLPGREGSVTIGDYVFIASSAVVLADVGDYATVGAGAVVVKPVPGGAVAVGNPARPVGAAAREGSAS